MYGIDTQQDIHLHHTTSRKISQSRQIFIFFKYKYTYKHSQMPLIHGLRSTNIWKAFLLNSMASTLLIFIAVTIKDRYDTFVTKKHQHIIRTTNFKSMTLTLIGMFLASMVAYTFMWFVFGFGGGMLVGTS